MIDIECLLIQGNLCIKSELLQTEMTHSAHINDAAGMPEKDVMIWQIVTPVNMAVSLLWAKSTNWFVGTRRAIEKEEEEEKTHQKATYLCKQWNTFFLMHTA